MTTTGIVLLCLFVFGFGLVCGSTDDDVPPMLGVFLMFTALVIAITRLCVLYL